MYRRGPSANERLRKRRNVSRAMGACGHVGDDSPPTIYRTQGTKRAVSVDLPGLRGGADEASARAHAMAIRQVVGQRANGATCAGASEPEFGASDCRGVIWNSAISDGRIGLNRKSSHIN